MEWALLAIAIVAVILVIVVYNGLVMARNLYKNAFAQIDVQLTRRYDLIPNLVDTAKRYMQHEKDTLEAVIQARNQAASSLQSVKSDPDNPERMQALTQSEQQLGSTLGRLFALSEAYPDLKANQNMMQLSEELVSTENKVAFARQAYNDAVMGYNNKREVFPNNLVASMFSFKPATMLEIESQEMRKAVRVNFD